MSPAAAPTHRQPTDLGRLLVWLVAIVTTAAIYQAWSNRHQQPVPPDPVGLASRLSPIGSVRRAAPTAPEHAAGAPVTVAAPVPPTPSVAPAAAPVVETPPVAAVPPPVPAPAPRAPAAAAPVPAETAAPRPEPALPTPDGGRRAAAGAAAWPQANHDPGRPPPAPPGFQPAFPPPWYAPGYPPPYQGGYPGGAGYRQYGPGYGPYPFVPQPWGPPDWR